MLAISSGGARRAWDVFTDFCELAYCALAKQAAMDPEREEAIESRYMAAAGRYTREQLVDFSKMLGWVGVALYNNGYSDFLGTIYESEGFCEQRYGAQFFTPWELCRVMASLTVGDIDPAIPVLTLAEPACGSGRLVCAVADYFRVQGRNPSKSLWIDASDSDSTCQKMTYIQMWYSGIPGIVRHANSLTMKEYDRAMTAAGINLLSGSEYLRDKLKIS